MPRTTLAWNPDDYTPVRERVEAFRTAFPNLGLRGTRAYRRDDAARADSRPDESPLLLVREPGNPCRARESSTAMQQEADARLDALLLLEASERAGFPPRRAGALRRLRGAARPRSSSP